MRSQNPLTEVYRNAGFGTQLRNMYFGVFLRYRADIHSFRNTATYAVLDVPEQQQSRMFSPQKSPRNRRRKPAETTGFLAFSDLGMSLYVPLRQGTRRFAVSRPQGLRGPCHGRSPSSTEPFRASARVRSEFSLSPFSPPWASSVRSACQGCAFGWVQANFMMRPFLRKRRLRSAWGRPCL